MCTLAKVVLKNKDIPKFKHIKMLLKPCLENHVVKILSKVTMNWIHISTLIFGLAYGGCYHIETRPLICRAKSMDWFVYDKGLRHEIVKMLAGSMRTLHSLGKIQNVLLYKNKYFNPNNNEMPATCFYFFNKHKS